jgi:hypothetical protein
MSHYQGGGVWAAEALFFHNAPFIFSGIPTFSEIV